MDKIDAADIVRRLQAKPITPERLKKAKALAERSGVPWREVLALLPKQDQEQSA